MFTHEAGLLGAFDHPSIVRPVDISAAASEGHFAMELIHGRGLNRDHPARREGQAAPSPMRLGVAVVVAIAEALQQSTIAASTA